MYRSLDDLVDQELQLMQLSCYHRTVPSCWVTTLYSRCVVRCRLSQHLKHATAMVVEARPGSAVNASTV